METGTFAAEQAVEKWLGPSKKRAAMFAAEQAVEKCASAQEMPNSSFAAEQAVEKDVLRLHDDA